MSDQYSRFLSTNRRKEERRRRKKRKIVAAFVITILSIIAQWYNRRRPRHIVDPNEELKRRVQEKANVKKSIPEFKYLLL
jgi:hypothetical protein